MASDMAKDRDTARDTAKDTARDKTMDAAGNTARDAAGAAAGDTAMGAARDSAKGDDIGSKYLRQLGIRPPGSSKSLYLQFSRRYGEIPGRGKLTALYRKIEESETNPDYLRQFYEMKNEDLDGALIFNGGYQGDAYRQLCNWIIGNHDVFGKRILDAGCECGVMSCFLAMAFPNAEITAIDRSPNAIAAARELAARLEVENIRFICGELDSLRGQQFDTVVSLRMLQENCDLSGVLSRYDLLLYEARRFAENNAPYAALLAELTAEGGYLVSGERCDVDPVLLGWMLQLNRCRLTPMIGGYTELKCKEMENEGRMQVFIAQKLDRAEDHDVYQFWCSCQVLQKDKVGHNQYFGWYADMMLQNYHGERIDGFLMEDDKGTAILVYSLWTMRGRPEEILLYQAMGDEHIASLFPANRKEEIRREILNIRDEYAAQGAVARELT